MLSNTVNKKMEKSFGRVYSATYSGVDVYELIDTTGSIMRRKNDGWVNATHILKAANFPKAKRTRILEKDVQTGTHEKVQGGYGKYQGTWVPLETAKDLADEFGVHDRLVPLFETVRSNGASSPPPAPKHHHASKNLSVSERPVKAKKAVSMPNLNNNTPELGSFTDSGSLKKRGRPKRTEPVQKKRVLKAAKSSSHKDSTIMEVDTDDQDLDSKVRDSEIKHDENDDQSTDKDIKLDEQEEDDDYCGDNDERDGYGRDINVNDGISSDIDIGYAPFDSYMINTSSPSEFLSDSDLVHAMKSPNSQRRHKSLLESQRLMIDRLKDNFDYTGDYNIDDTIMDNEQKWYDSNAEYILRLLDYFIKNEEESESILPDFLLNPPKSLPIDQVLDEYGNTIFHWICSMGAALAADAFIKLGANYRSVNKEGETSLMRTVHFVNAYEKRTFPRLLELLSENIFELDSNYRTILHHIAISADSSVRITSALYYMEILLAKIRESQTPQRFSNYLNLQDVNGNTALHICAKNANKKCIKLLVKYRALPNIKNNNGEIASDMLLGSDNATPRVRERYNHLLRINRIEEQRLSQKAIKQESGDAEDERIRHVHPHYSETAVEASQNLSKVFINSLTNLSTAFDNEVENKDLTIKSIEESIKRMEEELEQEKKRLSKSLEKKYNSEEFNTSQYDCKLTEEYKLVEDAEQKLMNLFEKGQATKLLELAHVEEDSIQRSVSVLDTMEERIKQTTKLQVLQEERRATIKDLVKLHSGSTDSFLKMQKFIKLISFSADMSADDVVDNIDELLKQLEEENDSSEKEHNNLSG